MLQAVLVATLLLQSAAGAGPPPWTTLDFMLKNYSEYVPACIVMEACTWGLGSNFNTFIWRTTLLKHVIPSKAPKLYYNHTPSPYQCFTNGSVAAFLTPVPEYMDIGTPPEDCFRYPFMRAFPQPKNPYTYPARSVVWPDARPSEYMLSRIAQDMDMESVCQIVNNFWVLSPDLAKEVDRWKEEIYSSAKNPRASPIVAIHARGGDKQGEFGSASNDGHYPLAPGMMKLVQKYPAMKGVCTCIIVGDDAEFAAHTAKLAREILKCAHMVMRAPVAEGKQHQQEQFNALSLEERCQATKDYIIDLELLAWANFMVGIQMSNVDELAYYIRRCKYFRGKDTVFEGTGIEDFGLWTLGLKDPVVFPVYPYPDYSRHSYRRDI